MRGFTIQLRNSHSKKTFFHFLYSFFFSHRKALGLNNCIFLAICLYLFVFFPCYFSVKYHHHSSCLVGNWRSFTVPWPRMGSNNRQKETLWLVRSCHFEICSYDQRIHCVSITDFALHLEVIILCFAE